MKLWKHLKTISHHKRLVMEHCFRVGLYRQGIMHDLSKYTPVEFFPGVKYFQGTRSPNDAERRDKGYSSAWLHHKGRNKHHLEYWTDYGLEGNHEMVGIRMPERYVVEMLCDRMAASKIYKGAAYTDGAPLEYLMRGKMRDKMHPETLALLTRFLTQLRDEGEDAMFASLRAWVKENRK